MDWVLTCWRRFGRAFLACLVAAIVITPSLDAIVCGNEAAAETSASATQQHAVQASVDEGGEQHDKAPLGHKGACVHGHCHHVASYPAPAIDATARVVEPERLSLTAAVLPVSDLQFGLKRPPRA